MGQSVSVDSALRMMNGVCNYMAISTGDAMLVRIAKYGFQGAAVIAVASIVIVAVVPAATN